jgi:hypothetical protein
MFKSKSVATFLVGEHQAQIMIDTDMPIVSVQKVLNELMYFCVERIKEYENEEAQKVKDEIASQEPKLEVADCEKECKQ